MNGYPVGFEHKAIFPPPGYAAKVEVALPPRGQGAGHPPGFATRPAAASTSTAGGRVYPVPPPYRTATPTRTAAPAAAEKRRLLEACRLALAKAAAAIEPPAGMLRYSVLPDVEPPRASAAQALVGAVLRDLHLPNERVELAWFAPMVQERAALEVLLLAGGHLPPWPSFTDTDIRGKFDARAARDGSPWGRQYRDPPVIFVRAGMDWPATAETIGHELKHVEAWLMRWPADERAALAYGRRVRTLLEEGKWQW